MRIDGKIYFPIDNHFWYNIGVEVNGEVKLDA
jgi:hypothetical protein